MEITEYLIIESKGRIYFFFEKRLGMVSVPCIVDNSNGFFLFILSLCRLVVFRDIIFVFFRKFWIVSVCFETVLFVSVVSIKVRNTETNRKKIFLVSRNKPKQTRNRSCFGLFRFEPKIFFFHFEDTLRRGHANLLCIVPILVYVLPKQARL